jgi:predicted RNase H-like nuclease
VLFVGIDLAWSPRNNTGIALIKGDENGGRLASAGIGVSDDSLVDYVRKGVGKASALVAVDAPLIVRNNSGRRPADTLVSELFRKYDAGAYPANRARLGAWSNGKVRGEELVAGLERIGFSHNPYIKRFERTRKVFEVYPHPAMVVIFGLDHILRYKSKPNRASGFRVKEFAKYEALLKGLSKADPRLEVGDGLLLGRKLGGLSHVAMKRHEDTLDAVFCAYTAYYYWAHPEKCAVLGDMKNGYIVTPVKESMRGMQKELFL